MNACPACGADTLPGERFCGHCGAPLARACPSCGTENPPGHRFCGSCGTALAGEARPAAEPVAERRLVSVLFADLVGFTSLSEHRDPEEVRELLSKYFERSRTLIERYGGIVEKFIGDAVMAVWGTPVAREDDAERSVRAALALVQRVEALGAEVGMPELRVRAGVLTGNAAVEVGAESEGMVLGDTVNTASRLQSAAQPGTVLVDDATKRAAEAAIAFEDAGTHQVKGREQPVHAWTALRVVAGSGGARRGAGLEAPFVGRQHELQAIIEAGEESAEKGCARHIAVVGEAGSGKSRLLWEFFKYLDGIREVRYWHEGRCLSYGEGVAYWALAEMVRFRARIQEEEDPASAREKLRATVEQYVPEERERRLVEPRLAHLLRLEERPDSDRADLFSGWRLFFERLSQDAPVILAFEDLQWADSGLLDFVDYLLEWSAEFPIFVLSLGRSELRERRSSWDPLVLAPLEPQSIAQLLEGLAAGLPDELVAQVVERAEGIPLYAVETLRMLQDRGVLVQEGARYVVKGDISHLEVPETLHALVASRLDGLSATERSLLQDASIIGQSFTAAAVAALGAVPEAEVTRTLDALVVKQVLARDDDPRSPERGQYLFLQALLRTVAYGTLARRARKAKHVAAARHLELTWPGEAWDIAEVLASHYLEAIQTDPEAEDAAILRGLAREKLIAAGQAAASLALGPEAERYFEHAARLAEHDSERAELLEQAGHALWKSGDGAAAEQRLRQAIELYQESDPGKEGAAIVALATLLRHQLGRLEDAQALLRPFLDRDPGMDAVVRARALAQLSAVIAFGGQLDEALPMLEDALTTLEHEQAWAELADALVTRGIYLIWRGRQQEGLGVLHHALSLAEAHEATAAAMRARMNLAQISLESDQLTRAVEQAHEVLALARERGDRGLERKGHGILVWPLSALGRWDEAVSIGAALLAEEHYVDAVFAAGAMMWIAWARGDETTIARCRSLALESRESTYVDRRTCAESVLGRDALERGEPEEALRLTRNARTRSGVSGDAVREAYAISVDAAIALSDPAEIAEVERFVAELPPALATPLLRAGRARLQAELAHQSGDDRAAQAYEDEAIGLLRSLGARALLVPALLERVGRRQDPDALAEARAICEELHATRWLERVDELSEVAV